jgi:hypothetical protein
MLEADGWMLSDHLLAKDVQRAEREELASETQKEQVEQGINW